MNPRFLATALTAFLAVGALHAQQPQPVPPPTQKVPPAGVAIPDADRAELERGVKELGDAIAALERDQKVSSDTGGLGGTKLLPDIIIFHKAVDWALRYNEFFNVKEVASAKALLKEGLARAKSLSEGKAPWTEQSGLVVRGFKSRIDGSIQPYGVVVPATWKAGDSRPRPLWIWNHGRGNNMTELHFIAERMKKPGDFAPADAFVVHPYGRFCNATKFAGETDVFEAQGNVSTRYPIDPHRVLLAGFSMGGASAWHLGTHFAGEWVAVAPGAGFAETAIYTNAADPKKKPLPPWSQKLWRLYDATEYAANLANVPVIAYSGSEDKQKQAADLMKATAAKEGVEIEHLVGPGVGHKYEPKMKEELQKKLEAIVAKGRNPIPPKVRLVTYTMKYPTQKWVTVNGLEQHWERAEVNAELVDEGTIRATTKNVSALTFSFFDAEVPLDKTHPPRVILDGQELKGPAVKAPYVALFRKVNGQWQPQDLSEAIKQNEADLAKGLHVKRNNLQGPIDDAFMEPFVIVRPTGASWHPSTEAWVKSEHERVIPQWRTVFRGDVRVINDTELTAKHIKDCNLILWGDPGSNATLAKVLPKLPIKWDQTKLQLNGADYEAAHTVPVLIYPNPLNPNRYVVLNSSFTFRQGSDTTNALQIPYLPDWAAVDLRTPPSAEWPGEIKAAGFFNEQWQFAK